MGVTTAIILVTVGILSLRAAVESADEEEVRISLVRELELGQGAEDFGGVSMLLARDARGRHFARNHSEPGTLLIFDNAGAFVGTVGRTGPGPQEFQDISKVISGRGDTLRVFDARSGTYSVLSPDLEIVRRSSIGIPVHRAVELSPDKIVVNAHIRTTERFGFPLHLMESDSIGSTIGPPEPIQGRPQPESFGVHRALAPVDSFRVHAVHFNRPVIDLWTIEGELQQRFSLDAEWFEPGEPETLEASFDPLIVDLELDEDGFLWVLAWVRSDDFDSLAYEAARMPGRDGDLVHVESRTGDRNDLYLSIVEVVDPSKESVVATESWPGRLGGFAGPRRLWSHELAGTEERVVIWQATLRE